MTEDFNYITSRGLPGGPNQEITYVTGVVSVEGYRYDSPDKNNPVNIIESSNITMEGVDFPVRGYGNNGVVHDMTPGTPHYDYGNADYVVEVPMAQDGTEVEEKSVWGFVKEMAKIPGANASNLLDVIGIPANLIAEAAESLTGRGDGEFNFMDAMPSFATPGSDDEIFTFTNQNGTPVKNVAGLEDADGNPLVENPVGAFITNLATDPSTYVGAGVAKNVINKVTQAGLKKGTKNIAKEVVENTVKVADDIKPSWSSGVTNYGRSPEGIEDALRSMKSQGKYLDEIGFNVNDVIAPNVINHGNKFGRQIAEVALPNGQSQLFYKSSGLAGKKGAGKTGTTEGLWQPYGGHASIGATDNWFIKDAGYENFYDSNSFKAIANKLDEIESGWDMSKQVLKSKLKYGGIPKAQDGGSTSWNWKGKSYSGTLIPSMETETNRYARTENGKIKTLPKKQDGGCSSCTESMRQREGSYNKGKEYILDPRFKQEGGSTTNPYTVYMNYINGIDESEVAKKAFDKLNRIYYRDAKAMNMSPANYIMTYVASNS